MTTTPYGRKKTWRIWPLARLGQAVATMRQQAPGGRTYQEVRLCFTRDYRSLYLNLHPEDALLYGETIIEQARRCIAANAAKGATQPPAPPRWATPDAPQEEQP